MSPVSYRAETDGPCLVLCPTLCRSAGCASFPLLSWMVLILAELQGLLEVSSLSYLCSHWPLPPVGLSVGRLLGSRGRLTSEGRGSACGSEASGILRPGGTDQVVQCL